MKRERAMHSEELADAIEASLDPAERAELDRHCWAVAWERAALAGELEAANWISQREGGHRDS
jgi:hypothetical protein